MTEPSPERKALNYAENQLLVHKVYDDSISARNQLGQKQNELHSLRGRKRELETLKSDIEMEVMEELRRVQPDVSVAAFDRQLKVEYSNEARIREIRDDLISLQGEIDFIEYEIDLIKVDIHIATARLIELGGYLQFMSVIKSISNAKQGSAKREEGDPW